MRFGGIVLCGGQSSRMGYPKAWLPFGEEVLLQRVVRNVGEVVSPVVVVAAPGQDLPPLPPQTLYAFDDRQGRGPLEGLAAGLAALYAKCEAAYVSSCDTPHLSTAFVQQMVDCLGRRQIAVPCEGKFCHPLAAAYRLDVLPIIRKLLQEDRLRPAFLFEEADTRRVPVEDLRRVDPELRSLANINYPQDYLNALQAEGLTPPPQVLANLAPRDQPE